MEIEVVEAYDYYQVEKGPHRGWSMHIYVPEWKMDIRGIIVKKTKDGWGIRMPHQKCYSPEENKIMVFPTIAFSDATSLDELKEMIKKKSVKYILKKTKPVKKVDPQPLTS